MNNFINYLLESGVSLGALSMIYFMFLRKETFFKANRLFLLFSIVFSSVLPFFHLKIWEVGNSSKLVVSNYGAPNMLETITVNSSRLSSFLADWISTSNMLISGYLFVAIVMFLLIFFRIFQIFRIISKGQMVQKDGIKYVYINEDSSPYSFLDYLFVSNNLESKPGWEKMLAHESEHIRQGHTVDILILELVSIFQWFNPFYWLLRRIIKENHEYMADQAVLNKGVAIDLYKEILVTQFIGTQFSIANNFNSSLIKSRLKMMTKMKSSNKNKFRYLLGVLMACALFVVFACENKESISEDNVVENGMQLKSATDEQPLIIIGGEMATRDAMEKLDPQIIESISVLKDESKEPYVEKYGDIAKNGVIEITLKSGALDAKNNSVEEVAVVGYGIDGTEEMGEVFNIVEEMPQFPGGELALRKFIAERIKYPVYARTNGIQGKVYINFVVEKDGSVGRIKVVRSVDASLDAEAIRVIKSSPKWTPGKQRGENVAVSYTVPITFVLQ
ncbi:TonB family protein [Sunxiuqinia sp. A32]|uniref:TonB family protein n=1 Tax=Sunxiuqinia sp. A32 TaxID=3461496 RepID=UPI00404619DD